MGHLTRRLTYYLSSRRLSLPSHFVSACGLDEGTPLWIGAPSPSCRMVAGLDAWHSLTTASHLCPNDLQLKALLAGGEQVSVLSGSRVILPKSLAFTELSTDLEKSKSDKIELSWRLEARTLLLETPPGLRVAPGPSPSILHATPQPPDAEAPADPLEPPSAREAPPPLRWSKVPDGLVLPGPVRDIPLQSILGYYPGSEVGPVDPALEEDIAFQGILRPVVLAGPVPHRVIDGRKRLNIALKLQSQTVPAIVFQSLSRDDLLKLRYLLETTMDRWNLARQLRVVSQLQNNGASIDALASLLRKNRRTLQRYLRIAAHEDVVQALERGELTLQQAERRVTPEGLVSTPE